MKFLLVLLLSPVYCFSQNTIGLPNIINYTKATYKAGLQNWEIKQDKNGILYFANNEGMITYDGKHWKIYPLPNKTIVRSLEIADDGKIYVGGQDEIGFFSPNTVGSLQFHSLIDKINKEDRNFADVWEISNFKNDIFFRTTKKIFQLQNETFSVFNSADEWTYLGTCKEQLYAQDKKKGLFTYKNNVWENITAPTLEKVEITSILNSASNECIITTLRNGVFSFLKDNKITTLDFNASILKSEKIFTAIEINNNWIALGTTNGGVIVVDAKGKLVQRFTKVEGLQNNNVHCIFLDQQKNLWLGLDNGIDCIAFNSAVKLINPNLQGSSGYTAAVYNNNLYMGTSEGLFDVPLQQVTDLSFSKGIFTKVENTIGQAWGLSEINGKLLLAGHDGAFIVKGNYATKISIKNGYWNFTPTETIFPSKQVIAGNYEGLNLFDYSNNGFSPIDNIPNFNQTSRFVVLDKNNNIWVSHPYHGVYKVSLLLNGNYSTKLYTEKNGLPSTLNNHVYKIKGELTVATEKGVFIYNDSKDIFEPSKSYKKLLGEQSIRYLKEDTEGNIWFVHEKNLGVLSFSEKNKKIIYLPELNKKLLSGFEFIYPFNKNNIFVGGDAGLFHINYEKYLKNTFPLKPKITAVSIVNKEDSLLFGGYFTNPNEVQIQTKNKIPEIKNGWKTIRFEFATTYYGEQNNLEYCYRLIGFNSNWSDWNSKSDKEYTNLPAKTYSFDIKVRNNNGIDSEITSYKFTILPPWYQSTWAFAMYFLLFCTSFFYLYKWQQNIFYKQELKNIEEQKKQQYLHQLEIEKTENELIALRNEKLNTEIDFKNAELATSAMHLVQKGEIMSKIKTELNQMAKVLDNEKSVLELKKIVKALGEDEKMDKDWGNFAQHFDKVHSDFVSILKEKHPTTTPNEIKLSAYLRMNLSTKEIAQLMNISVRGIEISRYRLRKKLNLSTEVSLFEYLINFGGKQV